MTRGISLYAVGHATSLFLAITFTLCVGFDVLFPSHAMYHAWQKLLPGFTWISLGRFCVGLVECYGSGWVRARIAGPLLNVILAQMRPADASRVPRTH